MLSPHFVRKKEYIRFSVHIRENTKLFGVCFLLKNVAQQDIVFFGGFSFFSEEGELASTKIDNIQNVFMYRVCT